MKIKLYFDEYYIGQAIGAKTADQAIREYIERLENRERYLGLVEGRILKNKHMVRAVVEK